MVEGAVCRFTTENSEGTEGNSFARHLLGVLTDLGCERKAYEPWNHINLGIPKLLALG